MMIRDALSGDVKALLTLEESLFDGENYPLSARAFYYHIRHNLLLVAQTQEQTLAGYLLVLIRRRKAKLYSIGVLTAYQGKGVAQALLNVMNERLLEQGFEHLQLEVRCDNEKAISLYEKEGFQIHKTLHSFYKDGCDAYLMEKPYAKTSLS